MKQIINTPLYSIYDDWCTDTTAQSGSSIREIILRTFREILNLIYLLLNQICVTEENGFVIADNQGNIGLRYDYDGLDVALLSDHFKELIKRIDNVGLTLGETYDTAYSGEKGKLNEELIKNLLYLVLDINDSISSLYEQISDLNTNKLDKIWTDQYDQDISDVKQSLIALNQQILKLNNEKANATTVASNTELILDLLQQLDNTNESLNRLSIQKANVIDVEQNQQSIRLINTNIDSINTNVLNIQTTKASHEDVYNLETKITNIKQDVDEKSTKIEVENLATKVGKLLTSFESFASTSGDVLVLTEEEFSILRSKGLLKYRFYAIYKKGRLQSMYFRGTLFARRVEGDETVSVGFPMVFPIIFN